MHESISSTPCSVQGKLGFRPKLGGPLRVRVAPAGSLYPAAAGALATVGTLATAGMQAAAAA